MSSSRLRQCDEIAWQQLNSSRFTSIELTNTEEIIDYICTSSLSPDSMDSMRKRVLFTLGNAGGGGGGGGGG